MDERRKREKLVSARRRKREEGDTRARRYREPRRRFQLKCRHRRIAAVGVGVGVARVYVHNVVPPREPHAAFIRVFIASFFTNPYLESLFSLFLFSFFFFFDFITILEYCRGWERGGEGWSLFIGEILCLPSLFFCICSFYFYFLSFVL